MSPRRFTVEEVAEELHVTPSTVYRLMSDGRLGYIAVTSRKRLISEEQLSAFFAASVVNGS